MIDRSRENGEIAVIGAGMAGVVLARELAERGFKRVLVFEARESIGGNCATVRDTSRGPGGIMKHTHGPHIFHTNREDVWDYVRRFAVMSPYHHRVKAVTDRGVFSLPINLLTINQLFGRNLTPEEAKQLVASKADRSIHTPRTFEEQALATVGREIYETFLAGYTRKQWGVDPTELDAAVLKRLPLRFSFDDSYYFCSHQGLPIEGYSEMMRRMLAHPAIELRLGQPVKASDVNGFDHVFCTAPIDRWFGYAHGRLRYRTLVFEDFVVDGDFQGAPTVNYCSERVPYTRVTEHKHYSPWETHGYSICSREFSRDAGDDDVPFYPLGLREDKVVAGQYASLAAQTPGITFIGRLGTYRYLDMDVVVGESMDMARAFAHHDRSRSPFPAFKPAVERQILASAEAARSVVASGSLKAS